MEANIFERPPTAERRVVITGLGAVTPLGLSSKTSWDAAVKGQSGIANITQFDASKMDTQIAGEVKGFDIDRYVHKKEQKKMGRFIHLSLAATEMAVQDAGIEWTEVLQCRTGSIIGVGMGGLPNIEKQHNIYNERGPQRLTPFFIPSVITNLAAGQVSIKYGAKGPSFSVTSACASGSHSIGEAARYIRSGQCDIMIAGGTESVICPMAIGGFNSMRALSTLNNRPEAASRPWDRDRDGFVLSEGAATLILEDYEHASRRDAKIYGELSGYGVSSDAHHMTLPAPGGFGAAAAMKGALLEAKVDASDVGYINAHGTSTPAGDEVESEAIQLIFKNNKNLWVSSTKSMTGHALGAAGAIESVFSLLALESSIIPPTINLDNPEDRFGIDYVPLMAREKQLHHVLNNSFGFGGTNVSLLFSKC